MHKLLMTIMTMAILHAGCCSACVASDGVQVPPPKVPDMSLPDDISKEMHQKPIEAKPIQPSQQVQTSAQKEQTAITPPEATPEQPKMQADARLAEEVTVQQPSPPVQTAPIAPQSAAPTAGQSGGSGFMSAVFNMLAALAKVVLLIFVLAGVYFAYKKLKLHIPQVATTKNGTKHEAPSTVSEAVASYARHRLRKSY